jgi:SNF2 family DNA or RNA helicase
MPISTNGRPALFAHQTVAIERALKRDGFMLAHEMGTLAGKSRTAIEIADRSEARCVLVLCPKSVVPVWPDQADQWSDRTWVSWAGEVPSRFGGLLKNPTITRRAEALIEIGRRAKVTGRPLGAIVNYEASHGKGMADLLKRAEWDAVILDESHRIKLPGGKASRLATTVCNHVRERGGRALALTGTPMPHSPLDLYAQIRALDGGERFGTNHRQFCQRFGRPEVLYLGRRQVTKYTELLTERAAEFYDLVAPIWHRVATEDVLDLPDATDVYRTTQLSPKARAAYDALRKDLIAHLPGGVVTAANAMVLVTRLAQATSGFGKDAETGETIRLDGTPAKALLLADVLEDFPHTHDPIIVFCRFHHDLDAIEGVAIDAGYKYGELSGRRRDALDGPRLRDGVTLAGVQIQAGGVGIDLTAARHAIYYAVDFALGDYLQSRKRLHRQGQHRNVVYTHLLVEDSIDQAVYGALRKRGQVVDTVIAHLNRRNTQ